VAHFGSWVPSGSWFCGGSGWSGADPVVTTTKLLWSVGHKQTLNCKKQTLEAVSDNLASVSRLTLNCLKLTVASSRR
jgi:hypothetical protein